jgi:hypothetical protein
MTTKPTTRKEAQKLTPEILGHYHDLLMQNDLGGFEKLLAQYAPALEDEEKQELIEDFKHYAARILRHRWRPSK